MEQGAPQAAIGKGPNSKELFLCDIRAHGKDTVVCPVVVFVDEEYVFDVHYFDSP